MHEDGPPRVAWSTAVLVAAGGASLAPSRAQYVMIGASPIYTFHSVDEMIGMFEPPEFVQAALEAAVLCPHTGDPSGAVCFCVERRHAASERQP